MGDVFRFDDPEARALYLALREQAKHAGDGPVTVPAGDLRRVLSRLEGGRIRGLLLEGELAALRDDTGWRERPPTREEVEAHTAAHLATFPRGAGWEWQRADGSQGWTILHPSRDPAEELGPVARVRPTNRWKRPVAWPDGEAPEATRLEVTRG